MGMFQVLSSKGLTSYLVYLGSTNNGCQMTPTPVARQRRKGGGTALQEMAGIGLMSVPRCCSSQAERGKLRNSHQFMCVSCTCNMCEEQKFGRHEIASFRVNQKPCRIQSTCQLVLKIMFHCFFLRLFTQATVGQVETGLSLLGTRFQGFSNATCQGKKMPSYCSKMFQSSSALRFQKKICRNLKYPEVSYRFL